MENSIRQRLEKLPHEVATRLIRWAETGQLQSDLILARMRYGWPLEQWINENDRLFCILDLQKHTVAKVRYDISAWRALLPGNFPGYVVSSSRRLAAIGLRQRRRLIPLHDRIMAGELAIVCVFLDRMRWVVEVGRTCDPDMPLEIVDIWRPCGGRAKPKEEPPISEVLGIPLTPHPLNAGGLISYRLRGVNKARASKVLRILRISQVLYRHDFSLPPPASQLAVTPDTVDISRLAFDKVTGISYMRLFSDVGALHTARCNFHDWWMELFEEHRDLYCQIPDRPVRFCEIRFDMEASSIHTKLTVRPDEAGDQAVVRSFTERIDHRIEARTISEIRSLVYRWEEIPGAPAVP